MGNARNCFVELECAVQRLIPGVCETTGCEVVGIHLGDAASRTGVLHLAAHSGLLPHELAACATIEPEEGLAGHTLVAMTPLVLAKGDRLPRGARPSAVERGFLSYACAPFQVEGSVQGVVWALSRQRPLDPGQLLPAVRLAAEALRQISISQQAVETFALERDRYQQLAANVGDCFWTMYIEPHVRLALISEGVEELTGYGRDKFIADPGLWQEIIHPDDRWAFSRMMARVREGVTSEVHYRLRIVRQDEELRWAHTRGRAMRDEVGLRIDHQRCDGPGAPGGEGAAGGPALSRRHVGRRHRPRVQQPALRHPRHPGPAADARRPRRGHPPACQPRPRCRPARLRDHQQPGGLRSGR